jgi:hypothetical protein
MSAPKEPFYDERISPLMAQIIALCKEAGINMAAQFSLGHDKETDQTMFCTTVLHDLDRDDEIGVKRMREIRRVMYQPQVVAFTIVTAGPTVPVDPPSGDPK